MIGHPIDKVWKHLEVTKPSPYTLKIDEKYENIGGNISSTYITPNIRGNYMSRHRVYTMRIDKSMRTFEATNPLHTLFPIYIGTI